jgi:hypothetical protein
MARIKLAYIGGGSTRAAGTMALGSLSSLKMTRSACSFSAHPKRLVSPLFAAREQLQAG